MKLKQLLLGGVGAVLIGVRAMAQEPGTLSASGAGEVWAKPTQMEFRAMLSGSSELGVDAFTKYKQYKERTEKLVKDMGVEKLDIKVGGIRLGFAGEEQQQMMMMMARGIRPGGGDDEAAVKPQMSVTSGARLIVGGIEDLTEDEAIEKATDLIDRFSDGGLTILPAGQANYRGQQQGAMVMFVIEDVAPLRKKARELAFANARAEAEELAKLAGVKLGRIRTVHDQGDRGAQAMAYRQYGYYDDSFEYYAYDDEEGGEGDESDNEPPKENGPKKEPMRTGAWRPVAIRSAVSVMFEIEP